MTSRWRLVFRIPGLLIHFALGAAVVRLVYPLVSREARMALRSRWCRRVLRLLGVDLKVFGAVPAGCHLIAANHISWLDVFAIGAVFPCWFVAKDDTRSWPFVGWIAAANDTLFLRRASARAAYRMNAQIRARLALRQPVVIFPEGTTTDGGHVLDFYPALLQPAVDMAQPVLPLAIRYRDTTGCMAASVAYINEDPLWKSLRAVLEAPRTEAHLLVQDTLHPPGWDRRRLAVNACRAIGDANSASKVAGAQPASLAAGTLPSCNPLASTSIRLCTSREHAPAAASPAATSRAVISPGT